MHLKKRWISRPFYEYFAVNIAPLLGWRDPILVYQMGKVGSSSVRNSLFRCSDPSTRLVLMSHEFFPVRHRDPDRIEIEPEYQDDVQLEIEQAKRSFARFPLRKKLNWRLREKFYSERIYKAYVQPGRPLRAITLVREPVANNISMFFELLEDYVGSTTQHSTREIDAILEIFLQRYPHSRPLTWFDSELKRTLKIDVFRHPFEPDRGSMVVYSGQVTLLVLKCELDDASKGRAIAEFLGLDHFEIVRSNVTSMRPNAQLYREFKRRIRVPESLLDTMYQSKYARFFYSPDERARYRALWKGGNTGG